ncbi:MAG: ABC transporter ATP-binding protein/permease [Bacilli bacterium]|nr:ABC transporter ATP-binding protein/permease [Bacilli bacterium]
MGNIHSPAILSLPMIELRNIKKDYYVDKKAFPALRGISLFFPESGFVSILGPSGCGKTTLLNILGGLDRQTSGEFLFRGVSTKDYRDRDYDNFRNKEVGFIFQTYNLIAHDSVLGNVELPLTLAGIEKKEREEKAKEALRKVGLDGIERKRPTQLSGGQMQRVAIARAIVNNPSLILADEPTGALDSNTSVQVMEILKEISKDRLVIMVTHNKELAETYSTRIIQMKDGLVEIDNNEGLTETPSPLKKEEGEKGRKSQMSFLTAFLSSFKSIGKKKARTALTAIASSIGIIGVALVMAITNGFSSYVQEVEGDIASSVPLSIRPTQISYASDATDKDKVAFPEESSLIVYTSSSSSYVSHRNRYGEDYLRYVENAVAKGLASSVMYRQEYYDFHLLTRDGITAPETGDWGVKEVNVYDGASNTSESLISNVSDLPRTVFHEIYGDEKTIKRNYDVIYGKYPSAYNEVVLVTDKYNRVPLNTLKSLGIVNSSAKASDFLAENSAKIAFSDIVYDGEGDSSYVDYKAYRHSDFYHLDNPTITKIAKPSWTITGAELNPLTGISFTAEESTKELTFYEREKASSIYANDASYHPIPIKIVGVLRPSGESILKEMPSSLAYLPELKSTLTADTHIDPSGDKSKNGKGAEIIEAALNNFFLPRDDNDDRDGLKRLEAAVSKIYTAILGGADIGSLQSTLRDELGAIYDYTFYWKHSGNSYSYYTVFAGFSYLLSQLGGDFMENEITYLPEVPKSTEGDDYKHYLAYWMDLLTKPEFYNSNKATHKVIIDKEGNKQDVSWGAIDFLAYASSYARISDILVFPASLSNKTALREYLDAYNIGKSDLDAIYYRDQMFDITSTIGTLVAAISLGLSLLAGVSLVVSSIMTGIITYVSVIERTKEIGILRACGARKKDVGRLFVAECFLIGLVAGVLGIGIAFGISFPLNAFLCSLYTEYTLHDLVVLSGWTVLILLGIAIVLALIASFIPARMASRKDPVVALRSE